MGDIKLGTHGTYIEGNGDQLVIFTVFGERPSIPWQEEPDSTGHNETRVEEPALAKVINLGRLATAPNDEPDLTPAA